MATVVQRMFTGVVIGAVHAWAVVAALFVVAQRVVFGIVVAAVALWALGFALAVVWNMTAWWLRVLP